MTQVPGRISSSRKRGGDDSAPILVVAAVRQEIAPFLKTLNGNREIHVLVAGIGSARVLGAVRRRLQEAPCRLVISAGFAGATQPGFRLGDLLIASEVLDIRSSRRWIPARLKNDGRFSRGRLATVDRPLSAPEEKRRFGALHGAAAVDMETAAVAAAASEAGVPWTALRAVLDPAEVTLAVRSWREGVVEILRPWRWGEFRDFLKGIRLAAESLSSGLEFLTKE